MRTYSASNLSLNKAPQRRSKNVNDETPIDASTKLSTVKKLATLIQSETGLTMSEETIRQYCRDGRFLKGIHWVKPSKYILLNEELCMRKIKGLN